VKRANTNRTLIALLMVGFVFIDLFSTNLQNNLQTVKPDELFTPTRIVQTIQMNQNAELFRISSEGLLPGGGNAGILFGLQDVVGNTPLEIEEFQNFDKGVSEFQRWILLNVRYVVTKRKLDHPALTLVQNQGDINLYELDKKTRLPRAYMVTSAVVANSDEEALQKTNTIDPLNTVVLRAKPNLELSTNQPQPSKAQVTISGYHNTVIQAEVSSPENGILVFSEVAYPGWEAEIDGTKTEILTADGLLRAVPVSAGNHHVQLVYRPSALSTGALISQFALGIACIAFLAPIVLGFMRRKQKR
jgi:uncharacterized membrane protein YfhO